MRGLTLTVELNADTGAIILPLDHFMVSFHERSQLMVAGSLVIGDCLKEKGIKFVPMAPTTNPIYLSESYFGPWTSAQAQRFGFVKPQSDADLHFNSIIGAPSYPQQSQSEMTSPGPDDGAATEECAKDERVSLFADSVVKSGPWSDALSSHGDRLVNSAEFKAAVADLGACFAENGLKPEAKSPWLPEGAKVDTISAEQISLAVTVVGCKDKVNFTQRVADMDAKLQAVIVEKYADELFEQRRKIEAALVAARELLTSHGYGDSVIIGK